jgi:hypothetical protein
MQTKDSLGDRMKGYEACYDQVLPSRLPLMLRVDGRSFHTLVRRWGCKKPFDDALMQTMVETAQTLCIEIAGAQLAYIQSDEITVVVRDDQELDTQPWFGKRKLSSMTDEERNDYSNAHFNVHCGMGAKDHFAITKWFAERGFNVWGDK